MWKLLWKWFVCVTTAILFVVGILLWAAGDADNATAAFGAACFIMLANVAESLGFFDV
jgi:hypothetical protein